jgi:hypothetical protein
MDRLVGTNSRADERQATPPTVPRTQRSTKEAELQITTGLSTIVGFTEAPRGRTHLCRCC